MMVASKLHAYAIFGGGHPMDVELIFILMLISFIFGLVSGVVLTRPTPPMR
jgi:hypothetical protein